MGRQEYVLKVGTVVIVVLMLKEDAPGVIETDQEKAPLPDEVSEIYYIEDDDAKVSSRSITRSPEIDILPGTLTP